MKKFIAPVVLAGTVLAGISVGGAAYAAAPAPTASTAPAGTHHLGHGAIHAWIAAHKKEVRHAVVSVSATTIGITPQQLRADLVSGQSIGQVATANGSSPDAVIAALTTAVDAQVDQAVTNGTLTSAQGTAVKAKLATKIPTLVAHVF